MAYTLSLPQNFNPEKCQELLTELKKNLHDHIILDAKNVERISTPGVQVILSAVHTFLQNQKKIFIQDMSHEFERTFNDLGCFHYLKEKGVLS
jgi:anti-anti-sigma factor